MLLCHVAAAALSIYHILHQVIIIIIIISRQDSGRRYKVSVTCLQNLKYVHWFSIAVRFLWKSFDGSAVIDLRGILSTGNSDAITKKQRKI